MMQSISLCENSKSGDEGLEPMPLKETTDTRSNYKSFFGSFLKSPSVLVGVFFLLFLVLYIVIYCAINSFAISGCVGFMPSSTCPNTRLSPYADADFPTKYEYSGHFPRDFVWGAGTASYQIEGAYNEDGRGASIWDTFTGANTVGMQGSVCTEAPCPINDAMVVKGATGNVACDHYHTFKNDVELMKNIGLKHYRFSISWSRIIPTGRIADGINEVGIAFYNNLIDSLVDAGITPYITLYHWDLPQGLLDSSKGMYGWYGTDESGRPSQQMTKFFVDYADLCFSRFGDRVKTWVTFNEAWTFLKLASGGGKAPSLPEYGDNSVHPYIAGHNVLLAHAYAVKRYREKYQSSQRGTIGFTANCDWTEPATNSQADIAASERLVLFWLGWFADPLYFGDYPAPMRQILGNRLPTFTKEDKAVLKGSADFFGLNHYGTSWGHFSHYPEWSDAYGTRTSEGFVQGQSGWLFSAPWGLRKLLNWVHQRYGAPIIYVTEGGWSLEADNSESGRRDLERTQYYANYSVEMLKAINEDGVQVKGYFAWSLMDNFEWEMGYTERFGLIFNDFKFGYDGNVATNDHMQPTKTNQVRTPKDTVCWFKEGLWSKNSLTDPTEFSKKGGCKSITFTLKGSVKKLSSRAGHNSRPHHHSHPPNP